mgnify:CR=1 FL=1
MDNFPVCGLIGAFSSVLFQAFPQGFAPFVERAQQGFGAFVVFVGGGEGVEIGRAHV